jgi:hypothetical protein
MKALITGEYFFPLLISNLLAMLLAVAAWRYPRLCRVLFFLLFAWAGWMNWTTALHYPESYLEYAKLTWLETYRHFINGWFSEHLVLTVGLIASCQLMIAVGMLLKGVIFKIAAIGAIFFFLAILPLGIGSGFPCTLIAAFAMLRLYLLSPNNFLWLREPRPSFR